MADKDLDTPPTPTTVSLRPPAFNTADYLDDLDVSDAQKVELLQTMWWIMAAMVKMNYGVDSLIPAFQDALTSAGKELQDAYPSPEFNLAASVDDAEKENE